MKIMQKTIATLLLICMMFTLMPSEIMSDLFVPVEAGSIGTGGSAAGAVGGEGSGGVADVNIPIFRVFLSRAKQNAIMGYQDSHDDVVDYYKHVYPSGSNIDNNTLFLFDDGTVNYGNRVNKKTWYEQLMPTIASLQGGTSQLITYPASAYNSLMMPFKHSGTYQVNIFKQNTMNAYKNKTITSLTDLKNGVWKNYLPDYDTASASIGYIFSYTYSGSSYNFPFDKRIEEFVDKSVVAGYDFYSKHCFTDPNWRARGYGDDCEMDVDLGFMGLIAALYVKIKGDADSLTSAGSESAYVLQRLAGTYEQALEDYCSLKEGERGPVSLVIDTAVMINNHAIGRIVVPTIDFIQFGYLTPSVSSMLSMEEDLSREVFPKLHPEAVGSTYNMLKAIATDGAKETPITESRPGAGQSTSKPVRIYTREYRGGSSDAGTGGTPLVFHFMRMVPNSAPFPVVSYDNSVVQSSTSRFAGFLHAIQWDGDVYGFYIASNTAAPITTDPRPTYYVSESEVSESSEGQCPPEVYATIEGPNVIHVNLEGDDGVFAVLRENAEEDSEYAIKFSFTVERTVYKNYVNDSSILEAKKTLPELSREYTFTGSSLKDFLDNPSIELYDESVIGTRVEKLPSAALMYIYGYDLHVKMQLGKNEAKEFNWEDTVETVEGSSESEKIYKKYANIIISSNPTIPAEPIPIEVTIDSNTGKPTGDETDKLKAATGKITHMGVSTGGANFAEVKEGTLGNESYEVMGGVPSTETLYYSVGGSEFRFSIMMEYWMNQHSRDRTYHVHFDGTTCEYNNNTKGGGDIWEGINLPSASGASQTITRFDHEGATVTATWTGVVKNDNTTTNTDTQSECSCGGQAHAHCDEIKASVNNTDYVAAVKNANSWMKAMANLTPQMHWQAASDKVDRKVTIELMDMGTGDASTTQGDSGSGSGSFNDRGFIYGSYSYSFSNPADVPAVDDYDSCSCITHTETDGSTSVTVHDGDTTATATCSNTYDPDKPYTITVTYTIVPHTICGPCCGHMLPDLWDTWKQGLVFDYNKISQIRLFKLDQGGVQGTEELFGTDEIFANVRSGNPTYFLNIAGANESQYVTSTFDGRSINGVKNLFSVRNITNDTIYEYYYPEQRTNSQSSRDGRLRYTLAEGETSKSFNTTIKGSNSAGAPSSVTFEPEKIAAPYMHDDVVYEAGTRSPVCDGMANHTNFGKSTGNNTNPVTTFGHVNEWGNGCLYTNIENNSSTNFSSYYNGDSSYGHSYRIGSGLEQLRDNDDQAIGNTYSEDVGHHRYQHGTRTEFTGEKTEYSDTSDTKDRATMEWQLFDAARNTKIVVHVISDFLILQTSGGDQSVYYYETESPATPAEQHFESIHIEPSEMYDNNPLSMFNVKGGCSELDKIGEFKYPGEEEKIIVVGGYNGRYDQPSKKYMPYSMIKENFLSIGGSYDATKKTGSYQYYGGTTVKTLLDNDPAKTIQRPQRNTGGLKIYQDNLQILPTNENGKYVLGASEVWYEQVFGGYGVFSDAWDFENASPVWGTKNYGNVSLGWPMMSLFGDTYKTQWGKKTGIGYSTKYYRVPTGSLGGVEDSGTRTVNEVIIHTPVSVERAIVLNQGDITIVNNKNQQVTISRDQRVNAFDFANKNDVINALKVCPLNPGECDFRTLNCQYTKDTVLADFDFNSNYTTRERIYENGTYLNKIVNKRDTYQEGGTWYTTNTINGKVYQLPSTYTIESNRLKATGSNGTRWSIPFGDIGLSNANTNRVKISMEVTTLDNNQSMLIGFKNLGFVLTPNISNTEGFFASTSKLPSHLNSIGTRADVLGNSYSHARIELIFSFNNVMDCSATKNGAPCKVSVTDLRNVWETNTSTGTRELVTKNVSISNSGSNPYSLDSSILKSGRESFPAPIVKSEGANETLNGTIERGHAGNGYAIITDNNTGYIYKKFGYTGTAQSVSLPKGVYTVELWGASGGDGVGYDQNISSHAGLGGYTKATLTVDTAMTFYVFVGGAGTLSTGIGTGGGYNGGGNGGAGGYGGGGMTHMSTTNNPATTSSWNTTGTILVAGGGGGADNANTEVTGTGDDGSGGYGGGSMAGNASVAGSVRSNLDYYTARASASGGCGLGGSQIKGFKQGVGESVTYNTDTGGAGGGWFGGYVTNDNNGGAGGGSGYVKSDGSEKLPDNLTTNDIGSNLNIGCWTATDGYKPNYIIDNLMIILMGGTLTHTSACYETITTHQVKWVHTHTPECEGSDEVWSCGGLPLNTNYQHGSNYNNNYYGSPTCGIPAGAMDYSKTFNYTGSMQSVSLSPGLYKIEVYGAAGGGRNPGSGGYSYAEVEFKTTTTLYIGVGGKATTFNGGGTGNHGYGGGASHVGYKNSVLSGFSSDYSSQLLIVAGGAGGGSNGTGGYGGGGNAGGGTGGSGCGTAGSGATTTAAGSSYYAGSFGIGGSGSKNSCGGGGGFYGGGASYESYKYDDDDDAGGGGGSGYINTAKVKSYGGTSGTNTGNGKVVITGLSHTHEGSAGWSANGCYSTPTEHRHQGTAGGSSPSGCYTEPTAHAHTSSCVKTIVSHCTGELNTQSDLNYHIHTIDCMRNATAIEPETFVYKKGYYVYTAPASDTFTFDVYGGTDTYTTKHLQISKYLDKGSVLYFYVGGKTSAEGFTTEICSAPKERDVSLGSGVSIVIDNSVIIASASKTATSVNSTSFSVIKNETVNSTGAGRIVVTCRNSAGMSPTILDQILDGTIGEFASSGQLSAYDYLGHELGDIIVKKTEVFETYENFSYTNTQGVSVGNSGSGNNNFTGIAFANNSLIAKGTSGCEFTLPVDIEAKSLRAIRITLDNHSACTSIGVYPQSATAANYVSANMAANANNQVITIDVSGNTYWINNNITKLQFNIAANDYLNDYIAVKKIELLGHADRTQTHSGYTNSAIFTLSGFSASDKKGFVNANNTTLGNSGTALTVTPTGADPITEWTTLSSLATASTRFIKLKFKYSGSNETSGQLFYHSNGSAYNETNSFAWHVAKSSDWQEVYIDTVNHVSYNTTSKRFASCGSGWSGSLTSGLRFDWTAGTEGTVTVDSIVFYGTGSSSGDGGHISVLSCGLNEGSIDLTQTFNYTGSVQNITLQAGRYQLEVWGAQGAGNGGLGGYSKATLTLTTSKTLYIGVGGQATDFNGGWATYYNHFGSGGATHIGYKNTELSSYSSDYSSQLLIVAGGGGGSETRSGWIGGAGGGANLAGGDGVGGYSNRGPGYGGTLTAGGATGVGNHGSAGTFGIGGSNTAGTVSGGAMGGGGFYGGGAGGSDYSSYNDLDDGSGGGGSGYANTALLTDISGESGSRSGNGMAKITGLSHTHTSSCYTTSSSMVTITSSSRTTKNVIAKYKDPFENETTVLQTIAANIDKVPRKIYNESGKLIDNPIFLCNNSPFNTHVCVDDYGNQLCKTTTRLNCKEPHHKGLHYSTDNDICWDACEDDEKHNLSTPTVMNENNDALPLARYLQLDDGFTVYFPNVGDFAEWPDKLGLANLTSIRCKGYTDNMDTTRWTREKRVRFPFDVIYHEYHDGINRYIPCTAYTWIELDVPTTYFHFYLVNTNEEMDSAQVEFECEAINCGTGRTVNITSGLSYSTKVSTEYANKLKYFRQNVAKKLAETTGTSSQSSHGYILFKANPTTDGKTSGNNSQGNISWENYGMNNYFKLKENTIEKPMITAINTIKAQIDKDFEGGSGGVINPHNHKPYKGLNASVMPRTINDNKKTQTNRNRSAWYDSLHGGYKYFYIDVIGRIGNFTIQDTEDYRFANFFKLPVMSDGDTAAMAVANNWIVEGVVKAVDDSIQNYYVGDTYDIRLNKASPSTHWLNTHGSQTWMEGVAERLDSGLVSARNINNPNLVSQILTSDLNNIEVYKGQNSLKIGYNILASIETLGSYYGGYIQMIPKYYALKLDNERIDGMDAYNNAGSGSNAYISKNTYIPLDVYIEKDGEKLLVNGFNNAANGNANINYFDSDRFYDYTFNLDWITERSRRNYTIEEHNITDGVVEHYKSILYGEGSMDEAGNLIANPTIEQVYKYEIPNGLDNPIGTIQYSLLSADKHYLSQTDMTYGVHRTFIGSSKTYGNNNWSQGGGFTSAFGVEKNADGVFQSYAFDRAVQRWHTKFGLPDSSLFVPTGVSLDDENITWIDPEAEDAHFAIVVTVDIVAQGTKWSLGYSQPWFKEFTLNEDHFDTSYDRSSLVSNNANHYPGHRNADGSLCPHCLPPIIAVYGGGKTPSEYDIIKTH